jgi:hypothetical protein
VALGLLLLGVATGAGYVIYPGQVGGDAAIQNSAGVVPGLSKALGHSLPKRISALKPKPKPKPKPKATTAPKSQPTLPEPATPLGVGSYAGALLLDKTGSQLASWNQTSSYCPAKYGWSSDGTVGTDSAGDVTLVTSGKSGSCAALISPGAYSSGVIEADIDFPALPGSPGTIANWTSFWLTYGPTWPASGELDAVEVEPVDGQNAVTWQCGKTSSSLTAASTADFDRVQLPVESANLTPGWHVVDVVYTKGFFAVYYDGHQYTSYTSSNITGSALNIQITTGVTPDNSSIAAQIGGPPKNSDSSPATLAVKYVKVWSFK